MSSSGERTHLKLLTVGDFDPQTDQAIEYDFIGRVIAGRYTVRAHIGGGGMADVFQATDEELGVDVAIKLLKPRMASDELRGRMVHAWLHLARAGRGPPRRSPLRRRLDGRHGPRARGHRML